MTAREASLKVTLRSGAFNAELNDMTTKVKGAGSKMGKALKGSLNDGFKAAKASANELAGSIKSTIGMAASLGGAVSGGALIKSAVEAEVAYIALADKLTSATGAAVSQADAQRMVEDAAGRSGTSIQAMRESLDQLSGSGDLTTIEDAMTRTAMQAKRLRVPVEQVSQATSLLLAKGIASSASEAEILLERMNKFSKSVLGLSTEEALAPNDIAEFAAFANLAGSNVSELTTLLSKTGDEAKDLGGAIEIMEEMGLVLNTRRGLAALGKDSSEARDATDLAKGSVENLLGILETGSPKAINALEKALATDKAKSALKELLGTDLHVKLGKGTATREELKAIGTNLRDELSKSGDNVAIQNRIDETNAKLQKAASAKMTKALNELEKAFTTPKMIRAVTDLADKLPVLVDAVVDAAEFIVDNPWDSLAAIVGGKLSLAFGGAFLQSIIAKGMASMFARAAAANVAMAATAGGAKLGIGASMGAAGAAVGAGGGGAALAAGAATVAGAAIAAGAAGAAAGTGAGALMYHLGSAKEEVDAMTGADLATSGAGIAARSGNQAKIEQALVKLAEAKQSMADDKSAFNTVFGNMASWVTDVKSPAEQRKSRMAEIAAEETKLKAALSKLADSAITTTNAMKKAAGTASTTRGPLIPAEPQAGTAPAR